MQCFAHEPVHVPDAVTRRATCGILAERSQQRQVDGPAERRRPGQSTARPNEANSDNRQLGQTNPTRAGRQPGRTKPTRTGRRLGRTKPTGPAAVLAKRTQRAPPVSWQNEPNRLWPMGPGSSRASALSAGTRACAVHFLCPGRERCDCSAERTQPTGRRLGQTKPTATGRWPGQTKPIGTGRHARPNEPNGDRWTTWPNEPNADRSTASPNEANRDRSTAWPKRSQRRRGP